MPFQALPDGSIVEGPDYRDYDEVQTVQDALTLHHWVIEEHVSGNGGYHRFRIRNRTDVLTLHAYIKKISWRNRDAYERAAQFPADHNIVGRNLENSVNEKSFVIGVYKANAESQPILGGWLLRDWGTSGRAFNCFIDVRVLAEAYVRSFSFDNTKDRLAVSFVPELLHYFLFYSEPINAGRNYDITSIKSSTGAAESTLEYTKFPQNKIIYGAPGTGKSYELDRQAIELDGVIRRITFHPSLTYGQFVGAYKPVPIYRDAGHGVQLYDADRLTPLQDRYNKEPLIDYKFVPGILIKSLVAALRDANRTYILVVEEINRANAAAVFGDVFQLLDRDFDGWSKYEIEFNPDISNYLQSEGFVGPRYRLPPNLYIWATMNSADQGVLPLDAAFKRRWTFEYVPLDSFEEAVDHQLISFQGSKYSWNDFRRTINEKLNSIGVPEDKLLGPFFISSSDLSSDDSVKNKLLLYLRDDVVRHNPESLFYSKSFSDIVKSYDCGESVFRDIEMPATRDTISESQDTNGTDNAATS